MLLQCKARLSQPAHRKAKARQEQAFGVPSITVCPFAPTAAESHFNRHPTKSIINHAAPPPPFGVQCSALRQTRDCMYVGVACQWSSRTSFYSLDHVSVRHDTAHTMFYCNFGSRLSNPTVYYATAAAAAAVHSSVPQLLKPTPCCHVFNAAVKKSHTLSVSESPGSDEGTKLVLSVGG